MMNQESNKHVRWKVRTKNAGMHNRIKNIIHQLFIVFHQISFLKVIKKQLVFTEFFFLIYISEFPSKCFGFSVLFYVDIVGSYSQFN